MRELHEVLWRSGHSTGEPTKRQDGMAAMQALLGKLPREAKKKLTKAEVFTKAQPAPTQVVVISGGELQAMVFFRFTNPESLVVVAEFGAKAKTFKGAPGQAQQLGTQAGTWLRKLLLASKKKTKREGTETMLDKLLQEMREQAGLSEEGDLEEAYSTQHGKAPRGNWGLAAPVVRAAAGQYDSLQDYIGRIKTLAKEIAKVWPEKGFPGSHVSQMEQKRDAALQQLAVANKHALEAVKALREFKLWTIENAPDARKYMPQ